jgi:hypothetical protein
MTTRRARSSATVISLSARMSRTASPHVAAPRAARAQWSRLVGLDHRLRAALRLDVGLLRNVRDGIGVRQAGLRRRQAVEVRRQLIVVERHIRQQRPQLLVVAAGHRRERVERGEHERLLLGLEVHVQDRHRRCLLAERQGHPEVAVDDVPGAAVHEHLLDPADLAEDAGQGLLLGLRMEPPVGGVGEQPLGRLLAGAHDAVRPGGRRGRCHLGHSPCIGRAPSE